MFAITGTGTALPRRRVSSGELEARHGLAPGSLERAPGVDWRHYAQEETQIDLGTAAAEAALEEAGIEAGDIDLLIHAAAVPYQPIPNTSTALMLALGIADGEVETLDINTTCLSFLSALDKTIRLIGAGLYRRVLIVSSEIASRGLPWPHDPQTAALFGDGAAAAVIEPGSWLLSASRFRSYPSGWNHCQLRSGGTALSLRNEPEEFSRGSFFQMSGRDIYRDTLRHFPGFIEALLAAANVTLPEIDTIIPHQASPHALTHVKRMLDIRDGQMIETIQETGNMISASIPFTLNRAKQTGRVLPGQRLLILGTSAGMSLGGAVMEIAQ